LFVFEASASGRRPWRDPQGRIAAHRLASLAISGAQHLAARGAGRVSQTISGLTCRCANDAIAMDGSRRSRRQVTTALALVSQPRRF
jgi:hypothetical protein